MAGNFLLDTGAAYSVLVSYSGQLSSQSSQVMGINGVPSLRRFTPPLCCLWGKTIFSHQFLVMAECPTPLLGRDLLSKLGTQVTFSAHEDGQIPIIAMCCPLSSDIPCEEKELQVNPQVWASDIPGQALKARPIIIRLKDPNNFPNRKQYPIKPEAREGLQPLIDKSLKHGLLTPCNSPRNTPILPVRKRDGEYRLVQDLRVINEAVIPIHPIVPNPYTILGEIPPGTKWVSILDLKDAFFCIPLVSFCLPLNGSIDRTQSNS